MSSQPSALADVTERLLKCLNRDVTDSFAQTIVTIFRQQSSRAGFVDATSVFGLNEEDATLIYSLISQKGGALASTTQTAAAVPVRTKQHAEKAPKRQIALDFEDEVATPPAAPKPRAIKFKKIKKTDALRIRGHPDAPQTQPPATDNAGAHQPASQRENHIVATPDTPSSNATHHSPEFSPDDPDFADFPDLPGSPTSPGSDIANDRDWYALDEPSTAIVDTYGSEIPPPPRRPAVGGAYDAQSGRYIDYDHDPQQKAPTVLVPHRIVPPFLHGTEADLQMQFGALSAGRSGASVSTVKDPGLELAEAARNGSAVVRELREKRERAQQARDATSGGAGAVIAGLENRDGAAANDAKNESTQSEKGAANEETAKNDRERIQQQRRSLPAYSARDQLLRTIAESQIVVVVGETGSGKTTQIPQFLVEAGYTRSLADDGELRLVACTQPRRVAAMAVAKRVSHEMGVQLGQEVGYLIRFEDRTLPRHTRLKYMTEGILLRELLMDPQLLRYLVVVMDEAHERLLNTDVLLGLLRQLVRRRRDLRVIVTSATMNAGRFCEYFGKAPQFFIPGRTFPVETFYSKSATPDYVEAAVRQVVTIHLANAAADGDILVFMTGQEDIEATCELVQKKLDLLEAPPPLDILPIYSSLPADTQQRIFQAAASGRRKVVVATNIAETSLTVDGVRYVVDCGLAKVKLFSPKLGMDALQVVPILAANADQRSGRAGRTAPGIAYRLYTEAAALPAQMYRQPVPEIQRANLSLVVLTLKLLGVGDILDFPFLDPPPRDLLACSLYDLWAMGALGSRGELSEMGRRLSVFPMEPTLAKLILLLCEAPFSCSREILTIVLMLLVPSVFYRPKERAGEADAAHEKFAVPDLDHLTLLNVFDQWEQRARVKNTTGPKLAQWCTRNFLHSRSLLRARDIRNQLVTIMRAQKLPVVRSPSDVHIRRCLCAAFFHQLARLVRAYGGRQPEYVHLRQLYLKMYLHPTSSLLGGAGIPPAYVVYHELVLTSREYMQCVTLVEPEWLIEYGFVFYGVPGTKVEEVERRLGLDKEESVPKTTRKQVPKREKPKLGGF